MSVYCQNCDHLRTVNNQLQAELATAKMVNVKFEHLAIEQARGFEALQTQLATAKKQLLEYEQTEAAVCPEDVGVKEYVGLLKAQLDTARETNRKLHRRCQLAESAVKENIDECKRKGQSLGRRLAGAGYAMIEADVATTKAENERLKDFARPVIRQKCWSYGDLDGGDVQEWAEKLGLLVPKIATAEDVHEECDFEVGDNIFVFSETLKEK